MNLGHIQSLSEEVINKIAAGEVVERPSSVVKELLENALDANATWIEIQIEEGGKKRIRITDNGNGMGEDDLNLCYLRHTTSKLRSAEDLFHLKTNGFRGEAIASIAAISQMTITSRTENDSEARWIRLSGGNLQETGTNNSRKGTSFLVEDLFFNTPVRRNFLGSDALEGSRVLDTVTRIAIANPQVRIDYKVNGRDIFTGVEGSDLRNRIAEALGAGIARKMVPVDHTEAGIHVTGFVAPADETRGKRNHMFFYLQQRPIWNPVAGKAVVRAYEPYGKQGYPVTVLFLDMPDMDFDVNVHPTKKEVRFVNENGVFLAIHHAVRNALQNEGEYGAPVIHLSDAVPNFSPVGTSNEASSATAYAATGSSFSNDTVQEPRRRFEAPPEPIAQDLFSLPEFGKVIPLTSKTFQTPTKVESFASPQFFHLAKTYLVCEDAEGLLLIDQGAAHQRILYERALKTIENGSGIETQELLFPELIELSKVEASLLQSVLENMDQLGFHLEPFGGGSFQLRGIPRELPLSRAIDAVHELVESLLEEGFDANPAHDIIAKAWAKGNAYQAGDSQSPEEMAQLMAQLIATQDPMTSPYGRPTLMRMPIEDINKRFKR